MSSRLAVDAAEYPRRWEGSQAVADPTKLVHDGRLFVFVDQLQEQERVPFILKHNRPVFDHEKTVDQGNASKAQSRMLGNSLTEASNWAIVGRGQRRSSSLRNPGSVGAVTLGISVCVVSRCRMLAVMTPQRLEETPVHCIWRWGV